MKPFQLPYEQTGRFSQLVLDHLDEDPFVAGLSAYPPTLEGLLKAAAGRRFDPETRKALVAAIQQQYTGLELYHEAAASLKALAADDTLTVTTGHQLCLFTGPLYVPLKILNTVRLARRLRTECNGPAVVPIFWMATEDHDRDEVDHAWINGSKFRWNGEASGAMGRCRLNGIDELVRDVGDALGAGSHAQELRDLITRCYRPEHTLAQATRMFINALFGRFGVLCLDADDPDLKQIFLPVMEQELRHRVVQHSLNGSLATLAGKYKVQASPREINLFHLNDRERQRIIPKGDRDVALEHDAATDLDRLLHQVKEHPEVLSPNVLLRPVYQECILPNVAYVGGGGELAYWLQLKPLFQQFNVPMPVLFLRSSVSILPHKEYERMRSLGLEISDLFKPVHELEARVAIEHVGFRTGMDDERERVIQLFKDLRERANSVDTTLGYSAAGAEKRTLRILERLEKRFIRAAKGRVRQDLDRLHMILNILFPAGPLQERRENFMSFHTTHGEAFFDMLLKELDPLDRQFTVLIEDPIAPLEQAQ